MRAEGEGDRSPEFKARRDALVKDVDTFLTHIEKAHDDGTPLANDTYVKSGAAKKTTLLGRTAARVNLQATEYSSTGIYFERDANHQPRMQIIEVEVNGPATTTRKIWEVAGSDPLERMTYGPEAGYSNAGQLVDIVKVSFAEDDHYTDTTVVGNGSVKRSGFVDGVHIGTSLRSPDELFEAETILSELGEQLIGADWREEA